MSSTEESQSAIEFELSAEELLVLSRCRVPNREEPAVARARTAPMRTWRRAAIAIALSVVVAALICGIAKRQPSTSARRTVMAMSAQADKPALESAFSASASRPMPVRFANPFDATEVFEFPPGTTPQYAREAVAEFLIDRARNRHTTHVERSRVRRQTRDS
jgi:hypothetical protein